MRHKPRTASLYFLILLSLMVPLSAAGAPRQSTPSDSAIDTIKVESHTVLVDAIVTDKKGHYVRDLAASDFKVWEDGKEQAITSFSREETNPDPSGAKGHHLVLFFDNTTMEFAAQAKARDAATKFIESNAGPHCLIAVIEFGAVVSIAQNFTMDVDRLKSAVAGTKLSAGSPTSGARSTSPQVSGTSPLRGLRTSFAARNVFLALQSLANGLAAIPGRKAIVMFGGNFPMSTELETQLKAAIEACNMANVVVYPVDVRGVASPVRGVESISSLHRNTPATVRRGRVSLKRENVARRYRLQRTAFAMEAPQQDRRRPFGAPGLGAAANNQQSLHEFADGTGGFVVQNTDNLLGGVQRIATDQSEYYLLGYTPAASSGASCHTLKVKVARSGTSVRSRSGYCKARPLDLLAGSTTEKDLEAKLSSELPGNVTAFVKSPYFYTAAGVARVHLVMDIPSESLQFAKVKGKEHAAVNVLGIAYKPDGSVAARFSDIVNLDFDGKEKLKDFQQESFHYQEQFEIASGKYVLKVVFNSGNETFGKVETPLTVLPFDGKQIGLSSIALSNSMKSLTDPDTILDSQLLEGSQRLIVRGIQVVPSATNRFKKSDKAMAYIEVYDSLLTGENPPQLGLEYRIIDMKTGAQKLDVGVMDTKDLIKPGSSTVPVGVYLPLDTLPPGTYRVDLRAEDSAGNSTNFRIAVFELN